VGYGDAFAVSLGGRLISVLAIFFGIMLLAIPISVVTGHLHEEYGRMDKYRQLHAAHAAQVARPLAQAPTLATPSTTRVLFRQPSAGAMDVPSSSRSEPIPSLQDTPMGLQSKPLRPMRAYNDIQLGRNHTSADEVAAEYAVEDETIRASHYHSDLIGMPHFSSTASLPSAPAFSTMAQPHERSSNQVRVSPASRTPYLFIYIYNIFTNMCVQVRIDASWSEPFLRSTLEIIRGNRRHIMSSLKSLELKNREHAVEDVKDFVSDMTNPNRGKVVLKNAINAGLI
jgi:hypothetical protein